MQKQASIFNNENGSVIFVALIFLALLTLIGVSSINTSSTEVKIASNTQLNRIEFYIAESGWKHGAMWLEGQAGPPSFMNTSGNIVRNFGNGNTDQLEIRFLPATADIRIGDELVTSGLGGRFPANYPVATVSAIREDPTHGFISVLAVPKARLDSSREVLVIKPRQLK